ncbi:MAG TPA: glycosyltransferase family 39 protein [bacterium]|nr:glycosyltransferase family 39 protein [bacterium]
MKKEIFTDIIKIFLSSFFIFLLSWLLFYSVNINKLAVQSEDTLPAMFLPLSIVKSHTLYLDEYYDMLIQRYPHPDDKDYIKGLTPFYLKKIGDHYASAFPIITPIISIPLYIIPALSSMEINWQNIIFLSHLSSSIIMSLAGSMFYVLLRKGLNTGRRIGILGSLIYLFATINYALISQAMWQHGTVQLFLILATLYWIYSLQEDKILNYILFGLFSGLAILSRPTAVITFLILLTAAVLYKTKEKFREITNVQIKSIVLNKKLLSYLFYTILGILPSVLFFIWYNNTFYQNISNQGYADQLLGSWLSPFPQSFLGVWFSPSKGILIYSPIFVFSLMGLTQSLKRKEYRNVIFFIIILIHTLVISLWKHWYGGWSFGYRMSSDIIPYLVFMIVPFLNSDLFSKYKKLFYILFAISVFIEIMGIIFFDGIWHAAYDKGFRDTSWLWSIKDSEALFNIRRVLVKAGLMEKACPRCL